MARNASGTYTLPDGNPVVTGTDISSSVHNATMSDIEDELTDSLSRTGKGGMESDLDMNAHKVTEVATPTINTDAATKGYVDTATGNRAMGGNKITGLGTPTADTDAATKKYVDDTLVTSTGGITEATGWAVTATIKKSQSLVWVRIDATVDAGGGGWEICTLDTGYRPVVEHSATGTLTETAQGGAVLVTIGTDGKITMDKYSDPTLTHDATPGISDQVWLSVVFSTT